MKRFAKGVITFCLCFIVAISLISCSNRDGATNDRKTAKKGWFVDSQDEQTYYLSKDNGRMVVGWEEIDGDMYYFNESHDNELNWYEVGDGFYESFGKKVKAYGSMFRDEITPDGKIVDADGKLIK